MLNHEERIEAEKSGISLFRKFIFKKKFLFINFSFKKKLNVIEKTKIEVKTIFFRVIF